MDLITVDFLLADGWTRFSPNFFVKKHSGLMGSSFEFWAKCNSCGQFTKGNGRANSPLQCRCMYCDLGMYTRCFAGKQGVKA